MAWLFGFQFEELKINKLWWSAAKAVYIPVLAVRVRFIAHGPLNIPPTNKQTWATTLVFCDSCKGLSLCNIMSCKSHCDDLFMIIDRFYFYQKKKNV